MSITIASTLRTNNYISKAPDALYSHLESNPVAFEIIHNCNVKPYYDFDWQWINNSYATKEQCTQFIHGYIEHHYTTLELGCDIAMMRRWIPLASGSGSGNTKLSLHFIVNDAGSYASGLDFYHFRDNKKDFIAEFEENFKCNINDVFVVGKDLFDQSVYKGRAQQQKFGLVMSRKEPGGDIFEPIDYDCNPIDIADDYERYYVTDLSGDEVNKPCCEQALVPAAKPAKLEKLEKVAEKKTAAQKTVTVTAKKYETKLPSPTLEIVCDMMNEIKDADIVQVQDRDSWFKLISAGLGAVRTHKLDEKAYIDFCYDWSVCEGYDIRVAVTAVNKIIQGAPKQKSKLSTFGELVKIYKEVTGKDFKIKAGGDLYDINPDDVISTNFNNITFTEFSTARELVIFLCGCVYSFANEELNVRLRTREGIITRKIN